jgi:hypothetical protein
MGFCFFAENADCRTKYCTHTKNNAAFLGKRIAEIKKALRSVKYK